MHGAMLKNVWDSAHAQNHVICLRWPKYLIAVVLADVHLPYWTSKVQHILSFTAIFSNICIARAQKRLFMNFRCKFRHRRSIRWPRFPVRVQNFGDLATFSVDFCIIYAEGPPYFYFRFLWPCHGRVQTCGPMGACIACSVISVGGVCGRCWSWASSACVPIDLGRRLVG